MSYTPGLGARRESSQLLPGARPTLGLGTHWLFSHIYLDHQPSDATRSFFAQVLLYLVRPEHLGMQETNRNVYLERIITLFFFSCNFNCRLNLAELHLTE